MDQKDQAVVMSPAQELNAAIKARFCVFEGPPRAYFELPYKHNGDDLVMRRLYLTIGLRGQEKEAARFVLERLLAVAYPEREESPGYEDSVVPVFVRRWFDYHPVEELLTGRLVFWDQGLNERLKRESIYRAETTYGKAPF